MNHSRDRSWIIAYIKMTSSVPENKPENEVIQDVAFTAENAANILRGASDWREITLSQEHINEAWGLLSEPERSRLHNLHAAYQQRNHPQENYSQLESAIASQAPIKEVGFGSQHFRQYQVIRILENGIAWVRRVG